MKAGFELLVPVSASQMLGFGHVITEPNFILCLNKVSKRFQHLLKFETHSCENPNVSGCNGFRCCLLLWESPYSSAFSFCSVLVCLHAHMCATEHLHVHAGAHACTCEGQRSDLGVVPHEPSALVSGWDQVGPPVGWILAGRPQESS